MNAAFRRVALSLTLVLITAAAANAQPAPRVAPLIPGGSPVRLGVYYNLIPGYGYQINSVSWGSLASQVGLEPGDVLLSVNGFRMTHHGAHYPALQQAQYNGGNVWMRIRDVRTGFVVTRSANLFAWSGGGVYGGYAAARR